MSEASAWDSHGEHGEPTMWSTLLCTQLLGCVLLVLGLVNYSKLKSLVVGGYTILTRNSAEHRTWFQTATSGLQSGNQCAQEDRTDSASNIRPDGPQQCSLSGADSHTGSADVVPRQQRCETEGGPATDAAASSTPSAQPFSAPDAPWGMQTSAAHTVPLPEDVADAAAAALAAHADGARQRLQACRAMIGQRRYRRLYHDHKAVLKVPGSVHPSDLDPVALPSLVSSVHSRPGFTVTNVAARAGCVLVKLDLRSDCFRGAEGSASLRGSLAASAQQWLQDSGLADQVPAGVPVLLQLDGLVMKMVLDASSKSWRMIDTHALEECLQDTLTILNPAILLDSSPAQQQQQQQQMHEGGSPLSTRLSSSNHHITVHALVSLLSNSELSGWAGNAGASPSLALPAQVHEGSLSSTTRMHMVANIQGYGYVPTHVEYEEHAPEREDAGPCRKLVQVHVSLPAEVAASSAVHTLSLELWLPHTLHAQAAALLLPPHAHEAAAELQRLPWASQHSTHSAHNADLHDFVADLGVFLGLSALVPLKQSLQQEHAPLRHLPQQQHHHQQRQHQQDGQVRLVWDLGVSLTQQAVLWGMPAVSTLVAEHLMALPHAHPDAPFSWLANSSSSLRPPVHTPASAQDAAATAAAAARTDPVSDGQEGSESDPGMASADLGGLLHLALLSPHPQRMLTTVLGWGACWGSSPRDVGFAWRWREQNALGFTPLDVLAATPQLAPLLRALLRDPCHGPSVYAAAHNAMSGQGAGSVGVDSGASAVSAEQGSGSDSSQHAASGSHRQHTHASNSNAPSPSQGAHVHAHVHTNTTSTQHLQQQHKEQQACYKQWVVQQAALLARTFFTVSAIHLFSVIAKAAATGHLHQDVPCMSVVLVPYTVAAIMMRRAPHRLEALCVMCCLARTLACLVLVCHIVPIPSTFWTGIRYRSGMMMEIVAFSTMEYVRPSWRILLRAVLCACYAPLLELAGLSRPWLQAVGIHGISLLVSLAVEARYRSVFAKWWQQKEQDVQRKSKVESGG